MSRNLGGPSDQVRREGGESTFGPLQHPELSPRTPRKHLGGRCKWRSGPSLVFMRPRPGLHEEVQTTTGAHSGDSSSQVTGTAALSTVGQQDHPSQSVSRVSRSTDMRRTMETVKGRPRAYECAPTARQPGKASPAGRWAWLPPAI